MSNDQRARELLRELEELEQLRSQDAARGKRNYERFVIRGDARLLPMEDHGDADAGIRVLLRDLGRGGLGFITSGAVPSASLWRIEFLQHDYVVATASLHVRHCREVSEGVHLCGGMFVADSGVMCQLGVEPASIRGGADIADLAQAGGFVTPQDVN